MNEHLSLPKRSRGRPPGLGLTWAQRICADLRQQILSGRLRPGDRLPPEHELARHYRVAVTTLRHGQRSLVQEGLIRKERRHGTFVCDQAAEHRRVLLVCGLNHAAGVSAVEVASPYYQHSIRFCYQAAQARGLTLQTVWQPSEALPDAWQNGAVATVFSGYIFLGCEDANPLLQQARREGLHHVNLGKPYQAERTVWFDLVQAARLAWEGMREVVASRGLKVVAASVGGDHQWARVLSRLVPGGIRHLRVPNTLTIGEAEQWSYQFIRKMFAKKKNPIAFVFLDDILARGGTRALLEAGLGGGQCPVVVACGRQEMEPYGLPVTYVTHDAEMEAGWAVDMLLAQIEGNAMGVAPRQSPFALAARQDQLHVDVDVDQDRVLVSMA